MRKSRHLNAQTAVLAPPAVLLHTLAMTLLLVAAVQPCKALMSTDQASTNACTHQHHPFGPLELDKRYLSTSHIRKLAGWQSTAWPATPTSVPLAPDMRGLDGQLTEKHTEEGSALATGQPTQLTEIAVSLVSGIMRIIGTDGNDSIIIKQARGKVQVLSNSKIVKQYPIAQVQGVEVQGFAGSDTIDLRGNGRPVGVPAWLYGGDGDDTIYAGKQRTCLIGGKGKDSLVGGAGKDFLYGYAADTQTDTIQGGAGDFVSYASGLRATQLPSGVTDIEAMPYDTRVVHKLLTRFRDAYGYVIEFENEMPSGRGDATLKTALAAVGTAMAASQAVSDADRKALSAATLSLLTTIYKYSWDQQGNPIRHPTLWFYNAQGQPLGMRPLSKDSFGSIMAACYYSYTLPKMEAVVKTMAKKLLGKYINYLVLNQFRLVKQLQLDQLKGDIYSKSDQGVLKKQMLEGLDTFLILPTEGYALKAVGAKMGFTTVAWEPWSNFAAGATQALADYFAEYLAYGFDLPAALAATNSVAAFIDSGGLNGILSSLKFSIPYSLNVAGTTVIDGQVTLALPDNVRAATVKAFKDTIRETVRAGNLATLQFGSVAGLIVDKVLDQLPQNVLNQGQWKEGLTGTLQDVLPWLDGENVQVAATYIFAIELLRYQYGNNIGSPTLIDLIADTASQGLAFLSSALSGTPILSGAGGEQGSKENWFTVHIGFWPTYLIQEVNPGLVDILQPFVKHFASSIASEHMGLWGFLGGDDAMVSTLLSSFTEPGSTFDNYGFAFERPQSVKDEYAKDPELAGHHPRIDYLMLKGCNSKGRPPGLGKVASDWVKHWTTMLQDYANNILQPWRDLLQNNLPAFAKKLKDELSWAGHAIAGLLMDITSNLASVARTLWDMGDNTRTNIMNYIATGIGGLYTDMANALLAIPGTSWEDVAYALLNGAQINLSSVAKVLWDVGGNTRSAIMGFIARGIGGKYADMANALLAIPGTVGDDIAYALSVGAGINLASVALALWDMGGNTRSAIMGFIARGIGGKYADMANALLAIPGTVGDDIAYALSVGAGINLASVALALWDMGDNTRSAIMGFIARGIGGKYADMANALLAIPGTVGDDIAYALSVGAGINLSSVAKALWDMGRSFNHADVFGFLLRGIGGRYADMCAALWFGIGGIGIEVLASIMQSVAGLNPASIASALWNMGAGFTTGNIVYALVNGIGMGAPAAWSLVTQLFGG